MARPTPNIAAARDLGIRASNARQEWVARNGQVSDSRMAALVLQRTGVYTTHATLKKLWSGEMDPHSVMIDTILAIARFLEVDPDDLGPVIAERRRQVAALAMGDGGLVTTGGGMMTHMFEAEVCHLRDPHACFGRVSPHLAGVVQRQNISFPS